MNRRHTNYTSNVDEENPYWISFSDLMSGLLVVFILAAVALIIELTEVKQKINQDIDNLQNSEKARKDILYEIKTELAKKNIIVEIADNETVLRIPERTLTFASNSYDIPDNIKIRDDIVNIGKALHQAINTPFGKDKNNQFRIDYLDTIFIEGHTDSQTSSRIKGNWGLSSYRAISLWNFWEKSLLVTPSFTKMTNAYGQKLFSMSGYAASRRVQTVEKTPEQRQKNRRIDIRFTVKRPTITELEEIVDQ